MTTFEVSSFQEDVIENSQKKPVVVDFWAPWCGPCRALGPVLEKLAQENEDTWTLVKVNTDEHPAVSQRYGIRGIPAVKLFVDGDVVDEFTGALPEYAVKQWLEKALPSENRLRVEQAEAALEADNFDLAASLLEAVLDEEPTNAKARILLAQILVFRDPARAESLAEGASFAGPSYVQIEEAVHTIARLMRLHENPDDLPDEDGKAPYLAALHALAARDFDTALTTFIEVIQTNRYYNEDGARKACIALFTLLGPQHPTTRMHRRTFDMSLY
jgi:putative thioredoxin